MFLNMDLLKINNGSSGHFDGTLNVVEETPSVLANGTTVSGKFENQLMESERAGRKRKTRRFKSRLKGKSLSKSKYGISKKMRTRVYPQSEAPNNTNQFLMAEHTIENLDDSISVEKKRHRESSFTSVDTEEEQFYSSPEDEDEFLTKNFDDAYQLMSVEKYGNFSKTQLTQMIIDLEAKVDQLNKQIVTNSKLEEMSNMLMQMNGLENDEIKTGIKDVLTENERLRRENEELKKLVVRRRDSSTSSSSSSTGESDSDDDDVIANTEENNVDQRTC